jgi:hypothetical protein
MFHWINFTVPVVVVLLVVVVVPLVTLVQLAVLTVPDPLTAIVLTSRVIQDDPLFEIAVPPVALKAELGA